MDEYQKTGYLNSNFKVFHLIDEKNMQFDFHYHDFSKIILHLHGNVTYCIEGRTYDLKPNDIVFVNAHEVHRPVINGNARYERIIIYISPDYLKKYSKKDNDISLCFKQASEKKSHVLRIPSFFNTRLGSVAKELDHSLSDEDYANELHHEILFLEFMIQLNRAAISSGTSYIAMTPSDAKIVEIIDFLNLNLTTDISIDFLSEKFFISRYHLMRTFKNETGYTIGSYITTKRLQLAQVLIDEGTPINEACFACGFNNYSAFLRAYKKQYNRTPQNIKSAQQVY